jgi:surfeit locus 1 family protein
MQQGRRRFVLDLLGWRFAPRLMPSLAALLLLPLLLALGFWQLERAAQKRALVEAHASRGGDRTLNSLPRELEATVWRYRRVALAGQFDGGHVLFLDNRTYRGMAGYHLLTPLRLDDGRGVLVNRGWAPRGLTREHLPPIPPRAGRLTVQGQLDTPPWSGLQLGPEGPESRGWPRVVQWLDLAALERELGYPLLPLLLLEQNGGDAGLVRDWRPVVIGPARHTGYAVQWFGLALTLVVLYVVVNTRRIRRDG